MIPYTLALQLKEAGFEQQWKDGQYCYLTDGTIILFDRIKVGLNHDGSMINYREKLVMIPTLSELIEACGDRFSLLEKVGSLFYAQWFSEDVTQCYESGVTPNEAVAHLFLALNKK